MLFEPQYVSVDLKNIGLCFCSAMHPCIIPPLKGENKIKSKYFTLKMTYFQATLNFCLLSDKWAEGILLFLNIYSSLDQGSQMNFFLIPLFLNKNILFRFSCNIFRNILRKLFLLQILQKLINYRNIIRRKNWN